MNKNIIIFSTECKDCLDIINKINKENSELINILDINNDKIFNIINSNKNTLEYCFNKYNLLESLNNKKLIIHHKIEYNNEDIVIHNYNKKKVNFNLFANINDNYDDINYLDILFNNELSFNFDEKIYDTKINIDIYNKKLKELSNRYYL
jgi:hypothetical protein